MKAVILAGGLGTRLAEETSRRPKPMVEIGGRPILWHIMKIYAAHGITDFIICLGYKGYMIKEFFLNYSLHLSDCRIRLASKELEVLQNRSENWTVTLIETGEHTMTGGRLRRVREHLKGEDFCFTYGDGVGDVPIGDVIAHHKKSQKLVTMTVTQPVGRFGIVTVATDSHDVTSFHEKADPNGWVNAGFFVVSPNAIDYVDGDATSWESEPLKRLVEAGQLSAYRHEGFWSPMDTLRDRQHLDDLCARGAAPWIVW